MISNVFGTEFQYNEKDELALTRIICAIQNQATEDNRTGVTTIGKIRIIEPVITNEMLKEAAVKVKNKMGKG
jgi:hypothetical protein